MSFNAAVAFSEIKGLYSLQAANFFCTLAAFTVRLVIVESKRRKMALEALIKAKQEVVVSVENRAFVVEQMQRRDLAELKKMQVRLQLSADVEAMSQEFLPGTVPALTDLQVHRPEMDKDEGWGQGNATLHGAICRIVRQGRPLLLQSLNVSGCPIGDSGMVALIQLFKENALPELSSLQARDCGFGGRGADAVIADCDRMEGVKMLDVRENDLGGETKRDEMGFLFLFSPWGTTLETLMIRKDPEGPSSSSLTPPGGRVVLLDSEEGSEYSVRLRETLEKAVSYVNGSKEDEEGLEGYRKLSRRFQPWFDRFFMAKLPLKMEYICLKGTEVSSDGWGFLAGTVKEMGGLRRLNVSQSSLLSDVDLLRKFLSVIPPSCKEVDMEGLHHLKIFSEIPPTQGESEEGEGWKPRARETALSNLPGTLETLDVKGVQATRAEWDAMTGRVKGMSSLRKVDVSESSLLSDVGGLRDFLAALPTSCKEVRMEGSQTVDLSAGPDLSNGRRELTLQSLPGTLEAIDLKGAQMGPLAWGVLREKVEGMEGLTRLNISESPLLSDMKGLKLLLAALPPSCKDVEMEGLLDLDLSLPSGYLAHKEVKQLTDSSLVALQNLPVSLRTVTMKGNDKVKDVGWTSFGKRLEKLEGLKEVDVMSCRLMDEYASAFFPFLPVGLEKLILGHNDNLNTEVWKSLADRLMSLTELKELDLRVHMTDSAGTWVFRSLPLTLEKLEIGTIGSRNQGGLPWPALESRLERLKALKELSFILSPLDDREVRTLFPVIPLSLEKLCFRSIRAIGREGWVLLAKRIFELKELKELDVRDCDVTEANAEDYFRRSKTANLIIKAGVYQFETID